MRPKRDFDGKMGRLVERSRTVGRSDRASKEVVDREESEGVGGEGGVGGVDAEGGAGRRSVAAEGVEGDAVDFEHLDVVVVSDGDGALIEGEPERVDFEVGGRY